FIFRVRVPLLGDGWFLVRNFAGAIQGTDTLLPRDEPLATYYFSTVIGLFGVKTYPGFLDAFFAGDMILGAGFILIAWATVRVLFTGAVERLVSFAIVCSLPAMNLFFGYVETYSVVLFTLALYAWTGSLFLRRRAPFVLAALAFLLQVLTHYLTILTLPSLLYLGYIGWRRGDAKQIIAGAAAFGLSALLVLAVVEFSVENYFSRVPHRHYLPVVQPDDINERYSSPYTMFSPYHAVDLGNLAVLLAAAAAFLFVSAPSAGPRGDTGSSEAHAGTGRFLLSASLPVVLFTLVAKFDLGMARDWDVIAPYSYLLTLSALGRYFRRARPGDDARPVVLAGGMSLACSLLWFSVNASPAASVERFLSLLDPRMIGQGGMYNGNLYLSRYYRQAGIGEERSAALWERYLGLYPGDMRAYRNIIVNMQAAPPDAVIEKMSGWRRRFGDNPVTRGAVVTLSLEAGNSALGKNRPGEAGIFYAAALAADSGSAAAWNNLGIVRARAGDFGDASRMFTRAVEIDSTFADAWFNLGRAWVALGDDESGRRAFTLSARFGNEAAKKLLSGDSAGR
ncbi:MAG TPA: hypothetical protein VJO14_02570, partial [Bacteroidota bacterium]|nr:hypothetical protein [Bacteroidota bacterium]